MFPEQKRRWAPAWCFFIVFGLVPVFVCLVFFWYLRFQNPGDVHRIERFAGIGNAFSILSTLFSGTAFIALIATIWIQKEQVQSTLKAIAVESSFQSLAAFQIRVGELIGKADDFSLHQFAALENAVKIQLRELARGEISNSKFLECLSNPLVKVNFPVSDAFRRRFVFSTLYQNLADAPDDSRETLNNLILAQIHDEAMRFLILQAIASRDESLLKIYAQLGFNPYVLNEFQDNLCPELERRFGFRRT